MPNGLFVGMDRLGKTTLVGVVYVNKWEISLWELDGTVTVLEKHTS
jgi:hypothetical protein